MPLAISLIALLLVGTIEEDNFGLYFVAFSFAAIAARVFVHMLKTGAADRETVIFLAISLLCSFVYISSVYMSPAPGLSIFSQEYLNIFVKILLGPTLFCFCAMQKWESTYWQNIFIVVWSVECIFLLIERVSSGIVTGFVIGQLHSNFLGLFGLIGVGFFGVFYIHREKVNLAMAVMLASSLSCLFLSLSRSALVALLAFGIFYYILNRRVGRIGAGVPLFSVVLVSLLSLSFYYTSWLRTEQAQSLSVVVEAATGKPLETGRAKLWDYALEQISERPMTGVGVEARRSWERTLNNGRVITLSVHNYYIAILHEAGILGFVSIIVLILLVYRGFWSRRCRYSQYGSAWVLAIMIHQASQVSLTSGSFLAGALIWIFWGCITRFARLGDEQ